MLGDERWSDRGIARTCGNGHPGVFFVGAELAAESARFAGAGWSGF
jgi:hypothetical protein